MKKIEIINLVDQFAIKYKLDKYFLQALVMTESSFIPHLIRYEQDYKALYSPKEMVYVVGKGCTLDTMVNMQKCSWGLCQLIAANYYELQGKDFATVLLNPEINLDYSCRFINNLITRQALEDPLDIYAAYNAGSIKRMKDGTLVNQKNVDRFNANLKSIKK